jgi:hypothetical protein
MEEGVRALDQSESAHESAGLTLVLIRRHLRPKLEKVHEMSYVHDVVNMASIANFGHGHEAALERDLAQALSELLRSVPWLQRWRIERGKVRGPEWDLVVSGPVSSGGKAVLCVECKGINFQPSQFSGLADRPCSAPNNAASAKVRLQWRRSAPLTVN